ncbi:hypothetical protein MaudCBS49596_006093 [Microsporum audouinii]
MSLKKNTEQEGRRKHLASLVSIFAHWRGSWIDFGNFLKVLFQEIPAPPPRQLGQTLIKVEPPEVRRTICRHNKNGKHYRYLHMNSSQKTEDCDVFNHERYTRHCITAGASEQNKNPGIIVSDICIKAKKYLYLIGKSNVNGNISQLTNSVINWSNFPPSFGESAIRNDTLDIDADDVVFDIPFDDSKELSTFTETIDTTKNNIAQAVADTAIITSTSYYITPFPDIDFQESSLLEGIQKRCTTKMRVATLAYLLNFADNPHKLADNIMRLRDDKDLSVLHLCGCGISTRHNKQSPWGGGCCEKTHLKLGYSMENNSQKCYHHTMINIEPVNYKEFCGWIHRAPHGAGLF